MPTESWTVEVPFSSSERIRDIVSREQTLDNINQKVATEATLSTLLTENTFSSTDFFGTADFTETRVITDVDTGGDQTSELAVGINSDSSGLFKTSDFTEARNVRELQNESSVTSGTHSGGGTLSSNTVPDGSSVTVQALPSNGSTVQIDGNFPLAAGAGVSLSVDNTDKISYTASAGDGIAFIVESA